jgi:hypothetical protein
MSGFMGYHPTNLRALHTAMGDAAAELSTIASRDGEASATIAAVAGARRAVEEWAGYVASLVNCRVVDGYTPANFDGDIRFAPYRALGAGGWELLTDPLGTTFDVPAIVTEQDAVALGEALLAGDVPHLYDTAEEAEWLAAQLVSVGADARLLAAFHRALPPTADRWIAVCEDLAMLQLLDEEWAPRARSIMVGLAAVLPEFVDGPLLSTVEPCAAAMVVEHLDLDSVTLAATADTLLRRWWAGVPAHTWMDDGPFERGETAGVLYRRLGEDPVAATEFLVRMSDRPEIVFGAGHDLAALEHLLVVGVDPARVSVDVAGTIVVPLLRYAASTGRTLSYPDVEQTAVPAIAAAMVAPWLMHFGARADEWEWDDADEARAWMRLLIRDDAAFDRIMTGMHEWAAELVRTPLIVGGVLDDDAVSDVSETLYDLVKAFAAEEISEGDQARFLTNMLTTVLDQASTVLTMKAGTAVQLSLPYVVHQLENAGTLPPDEDAVRAHANPGETGPHGGRRGSRRRRARDPAGGRGPPAFGLPRRAEPRRPRGLHDEGRERTDGRVHQGSRHRRGHARDPALGSEGRPRGGARARGVRRAVTGTTAVPIRGSAPSSSRAWCSPESSRRSARASTRLRRGG